MSAVRRAACNGGARPPEAAERQNSRIFPILPSIGGSLILLCSYSSTLGVQLFLAPCIFPLASFKFRPSGALVLQLKGLIVEKLLRRGGISAVDVLAVRGDDPDPGLLGEGGPRNHRQRRN